jgi:hypothetical protein
MSSCDTRVSVSDRGCWWDNSISLTSFKSFFSRVISKRVLFDTKERLLLLKLPLLFQTKHGS